MIPVSIPRDPAAPLGPTYDIAKLRTLEPFTRDGYEKAFGVQPPDFDPSRAPKRWLDTTAVPGQKSTYKTVDVATGQYKTITLPGEVACSLNVPGTHHYAPWVIAPTGATRGGGTVNAKYLSTREQAEALAAELGGSVETYDGGGVFPINYPDSETRRWYQIQTGNGIAYNVGVLLANKYAAGVDTPGSWGSDFTGGPAWVSTYVIPHPAESTLPEVPFPMRDLLPGERFIGTLVGIYQVVAAGVILPGEKPAPGPVTAGGSFADADRKALMECRQILGEIADR